MKLSEVGAATAPDPQPDVQPQKMKLSEVAAPSAAKPIKLSQVSAPAPAAAAPQQKSLLQKAGDIAMSPVRAAGAGLKDIGQEIVKEGAQNAEDIKGDFTAPVRGPEKKNLTGLVTGKKEYEKPGVLDYAARVGKTGLDILQRPFVAPRAALRETLGRSTHEITGGKLDPDAVTDAAMIAAPLSKSKTVSQIGDAAEDGMKVIERMFSPTTVSKEAGATEKVIRRAGGQQSLIHEKIADKLVEHNKTLANMPVAAQRAFIDDIENGRTPADPKLAAAAKDITGAYGTWRKRIQTVLPKSAIPNFINDYYAHIWKEKPSIVGEKIGAFAKQGSGRNFKARTIPTISDGIKAGLTPKFENPVEATTAYSQNMSRFVATHDMQQELKAQGYAKWYSPGSKNIPQGWVPLDGIMTEKVTPTIERQPQILRQPKSGFDLSDDPDVVKQATGVTPSGPNSRVLAITKDGKPVGRVFGTLEGKNFRIGNISTASGNMRKSGEAVTEGGPAMRDLMTALKRKYPDLETVSGTRVSGARKAAGKIGDTKIRLPEVIKDKSSPGRPIKLFAPKDVARVYNNFISQGFNANENAGPIYRVAQNVSNGMTQMKLGLSAFHLANIANESVISDYARAFRAASRGEGKTALRAVGGGLANTFTGGAKSYMRGMKMQRELLDKAMPDRMSKVVNDAFVKSGGTLRMDPFYRSRASGSFFNAIEKGTFKAELKKAGQQMYKGTALENAKGVIDNASNAMQTVTAPLFEKYIPAVKRGAFASEMEDFLKSRPNATQAEIDKQALQIADSIDNRFGELNQDNLFWNKYLKQTAQLLLLAPSWDLGTLREIGGGLKDMAGAAPDLLKGEGLSRRSAYVAGLVAQTALMSSVYQYLKTGKAPESAHDLMTPQTGGKVPGSNQPERALLPGYQKDVYAFGYDFPMNVMQEAKNKMNPGIQTADDYATNKDYRGLPIFKPEGAKDIPGQPTAMDDFINRVLPIGIQQMGEKKKGSEIGNVQRFMGVRPAPSYLQDPGKAEANKQKYGSRDWKSRIRADRRAEANQE